MRYVLMLNEMLSPNIENLQAVRVGEREELIEWHNSQLADAPYYDGKWQKVFRKDGPLEWFNPGGFTHDKEWLGGVYPIPDDLTDEDAMRLRLTKY